MDHEIKYGLHTGKTEGGGLFTQGRENTRLFWDMSKGQAFMEGISCNGGYLYMVSLYNLHYDLKLLYRLTPSHDSNYNPIISCVIKSTHTHKDQWIYGYIIILCTVL